MTNFTNEVKKIFNNESKLKLVITCHIKFVVKLLWLSINHFEI